MTRKELEIPPHFEPERAGEIWRVDYAEIASAATFWRNEHRLSPCSQDQPTICLLAVDLQNTFCIPEFELFVAGRSGRGAVEDSTRLCRFIYRNLEWITQLVVTLDSHQPHQIFHPAFLEDKSGRNPEPFSVIGEDEVATGRWQVGRDTCEALGVSPEWAQKYIRSYAGRLKASGKYDWTVWPYHAMIGGIGHALVPAVEEAIFFHSIARTSIPHFYLKGRSPWTEHYSALGPEVPEPEESCDRKSDSSGLLEELLRFDRILIAGQAKSHCVAWTVADLLREIRDRRADLAGRFYLLEDCTSPVVVPGVIDFTDQADARFKEFRQAGMHVVRSSDPITEWIEVAR